MNDVIITIKNYKGHIITFTMPQDAEISVFEELNNFDQCLHDTKDTNFIKYTNYINRICIDACYPGIEKFIEKSYDSLEEGAMF